MANYLIAVVGYGAAVSFAAASALGFFGALITKPESIHERHALIWWICGAILALLFAGMTRAMLAGCPA